jgi:hypothetical protein
MSVNASIEACVCGTRAGGRALHNKEKVARGKRMTAVPTGLLQVVLLLLAVEESLAAVLVAQLCCCALTTRHWLNMLLLLVLLYVFT